MQKGELAQELNERALAEGMGNAGVKCDSRVLMRKQADPACRRPGGDQVTLVEHKHKVLVRLLGADELLNVR